MSSRTLASAGPSLDTRVEAQVAKLSSKPAATPSATKAAGQKRKLALPLALNSAERSRSDQPLKRVQAKKLIDKDGAPTLEGLQVQFNNLCEALLAQVDNSAADLNSSISSSEAQVNKRAKADHAQTCQLLEDSEEAIKDARAQHNKAMEKAKAMCAKIVADIQQGKAQKAALNEFAKQRTQEIEALRKKFGV
jgi:hypothetical protein